MRPSASSFEPWPAPGQQVRWRYPRWALALGWFHVFGPGPFQFVGVTDPESQEVPLTFVIKTEFGDQEINAEWVGVAPVGAGVAWGNEESSPGKTR